MLGDEDVGRLDIAMDDPFSMRRIETFRNSHRERQQLLRRQGPAEDAIAQCLAFQRSITMKYWPSCWPISWIVQMLG